MNQPSVADLKAADDFVQSLVSRADGHIGDPSPYGYPYWHGWALRDAYLAGLSAGRLDQFERCMKILEEGMKESLKRKGAGV